ncbi:MAG TPA: hypothetical protein VHT03_09365 [Rhizomicrobium sp.]|jgi:hypothetical protein|nr:hypothetical protein [Rhizomicrobium sp.]
MNLVKLTGKDGARIEVNPECIAFLQKPSLEDSGVEITFLHGEKIHVRQSITQLVQLLGVQRERPKKRAAESGAE